MRIEIQDFVKACEIWQQVKYPTDKPLDTLKPLLIPSRPWGDIIMDFIIGLPNSKGFVAIMVIVDRLIKSAHFVALKQGFTASQVTNVFAQHVVKLHGFPRSIVSDEYPIFSEPFLETVDAV